MNKSFFKFAVLIAMVLCVGAIVSTATNYTFPQQPTQSHKIGFGSVIDGGTGAVCISSCDGMAYVSGQEACQIGTGSNATDNSFQYRDSMIVDGDGGLGISVYGLMQLKYIFWQDDFIEGGYVATAASTNFIDQYIPGSKFSEYADRGAWLVSVVDGDGDGDEVVKIQDAGHGGILKIESTDKASDSIECQMNGESFQIQSGEEAWFNARWATEDVDANTNVVGLALSDTAVIGSFPNDHILFANYGGDLYFSVGQNGTAYAVDTGVDLANATHVTTAWYWDGVDTITVTVNGTAVTNLTDNGTTILFPDDQAISPVFGIETSDTGKDYMLIDYIGCYLER